MNAVYVVVVEKQITQVMDYVAKQSASLIIQVLQIVPAYVVVALLQIIVASVIPTHPITANRIVLVSGVALIINLILEMKLIM